MSTAPWYDRGFAQSRHPRAAAARAGFVARIARLKAEGLGADEDFLAAQLGFHRRVAPAQLAELEGIAAGFAVAFDDLWLHLHAGTLSDLLRGAGMLEDGCSAFAAGAGSGEPFLIKNRDLGGPVELVQIARKVSSDTGDILALGSLLSPLAYSSGMNGAGLALADTHVPVTRHRVGWLRYLLMGHLLDSCRDLTGALTVIRSQPHCGGGTLEILDRHGSAAAVELAATGPEIETGAAAHWRSNHYLRSRSAPQTLDFANPLTGPNSAWRLGLLDALGAAPSREAAIRAFSTAGGAGVAEGLCQLTLSRTLSCALYAPVQGWLDWTDGPPCETSWQRLSL